MKQARIHLATTQRVVDRVEINGETVSTENKIVGEMAEAVRDGKINNITVYFK